MQRKVRERKKKEDERKREEEREEVPLLLPPTLPGLFFVLTSLCAIATI